MPGRAARASVTAGRACSALLLAPRELRTVAEARGVDADVELAADLRTLAHGLERLERNGRACSRPLAGNSTPERLRCGSRLNL